MIDINRINPGDRVRILSPQIFVRCGYPLCLADVSQTIDKKIIIDSMVQAGAGSQDQIETLINFHPHHRIHRAYREISRGLALAVMIFEHFGGSERKIYTKEMPELEGKIVRVESKRQVVTGDRWPGCGPGYYGDEAEGPSLENQVRHTLIKFYPVCHSDGSVLMLQPWDGKECEIEQIHVEKVTDSEMREEETEE